MQVLLWGLPLWMRDVVEQAIGTEPSLWLVPAPVDARDLRDALERTQPDVVVTDCGDRDASCRGFLTLLFEFPRLRVYSIGGGNVDTVHVTLLPIEESLGDVSLDVLIRMIASDGCTDAVHSSHASRNQ